MRNVPSWDEYFLQLLTQIAKRSKDPATNVGSIIVRDNRILTTGYNGFPIGVEDTPERWERPAKYGRVVHAEMNALMVAARKGIAIEGATLYTNLFCCDNCAKHLIQAGITEIKYPAQEFREDYGHFLALEMFKESKVRVTPIES